MLIPIGCILGYYLLILFTPLANWLTHPLLVEPDLRHADAIVILSGGVYPNHQLTYATFEREVYGVILWRKGFGDKIILNAATKRESQAMMRLARDLGVPEEALVMSSEAANTFENALTTAEVMKEKGWERALIVTSATHMLRAKLTFEKAGILTYPAPNISNEDYFTSPGDRWNLASALWHEYLGLLYYRFKGRI